VAGSAIACGMLQLVFFCAQNILQEAVTHTAADIGLSGIGLVLTVSETGFCALVPMIELLLDCSGAGTTALIELVSARMALRFAAMALVLSLSTGVANVSLEFLTISTLVVLKSAKLLPVMLVGMAFFRKAYSPQQWLQAALLVCGVILCVRADAAGDVRFSFFGCGLALVALTGDAFYPYLQERLLNEPAQAMEERPFKQQQMLIGTNTLAASYAIVGAIGASRGNTLALLSTNGWLAAGVVAHGWLQYTGLFFYLLLLKAHSPRTAVSYATVRKAATVLITMLIARRLPTAGYVIGAATVLASFLVA